MRLPAFALLYLFEITDLKYWNNPIEMADSVSFFRNSGADGQAICASAPLCGRLLFRRRQKRIFRGKRVIILAKPAYA